MYFIDHNFFVVPPKTICSICGEMPEFYCYNCEMKDIFPEGRLFLCAQCSYTVHLHPDREKHKPQRFDLKTASRRKVKLDPPKTICNICGWMPECYCSDCGMKDVVFQEGRLFLCAQCSSTVHLHPDRQKDKPQRFDLKTVSARKVKLDLLSVVCMEKNHYVCFCRHGNRWFFFDSMADITGLYV